MKNSVSERKLPVTSGRSISEIMLSNGHLTIVVHDFGARLHKLFAPDKYGNVENILLSKDNSDSYKNDRGYYGLICGPVAGRISGANYDKVVLKANEGKNLLHSGERGWERQFWSYKIYETDKSVGITLSLIDKSSGFPGPIEATVTYELEGNTLSVKMAGYSDKDTVFNPAFHPYFNLSADKETTLNHELQANVNRYAEADSENIPTGQLLPVEGTVYNLKKSVSISQILEKQSTGFDNCFVFDEKLPSNLILVDPNSGRQMICTTDRQAVVVYTATNPEQDSIINGKKMAPNRGIAIEFQELPDMVHHPEWGSIVLKAGQKKEFVSSYTFLSKD